MGVRQQRWGISLGTEDYVNLKAMIAIAPQLYISSSNIYSKQHFLRTVDPHFPPNTFIFDQSKQGDPQHACVADA
jgi:hypothetical protein